MTRPISRKDMTEGYFQLSTFEVFLTNGVHPCPFEYARIITNFKHNHDGTTKSACKYVEDKVRDFLYGNPFGTVTDGDKIMAAVSTSGVLAADMWCACLAAKVHNSRGKGVSDEE